MDNHWLRGLLIAAAGAALGVINDPHSLVNEPVKVGKIAGASALIAVLAYLVRSPRETREAKPEDKNAPDASKQ